MIKSLTARRLFFAFSILGLLNISLAYLFFYYSSVSLLEERSSQQMESVRALARQKLDLYLENLKINSVQDSPEMLTTKELPKNVHVLNQGDDRYFLLAPLSFTPKGEDLILLKIPIGKKSVVWEFSYEGLNRVLSEHAGLGQTGEIYLVGQDNKIKSASRHIRDWKNTVVDNKSIKKGKQNKSGVHVVKDYRNVEVVSAYSGFNFDKLNFILLSEIDTDEVFRPLKSLFPKIFIICAVLCLLSTIISYLSSEKIVKLIEQMRMQINQMHIQFITTIEEEKRSMSFNLHDGVGQILTALKWGVSRNEDQDKLKALCDEAFKEIRSVSDNLMPTELSELGFYPAVRNFLRKQETYYKLNIHFWYNERLESYKFLPGLEVNIYRMIQEFLHNTLKHAGAHSATLVMFRENENLLIRYEDDGVGMPDSAPMPRILQYRTDLMGAKLTRPQSLKGLVLQVHIPLNRVFHEST
jgi:signal transduction histidine kinase